jgi:alcohol dehydrogenase
MARAKNAATVVVCDPDAARRDRAMRFGADIVAPPDPEPLAAAIAGVTPGRGADVVLELAGMADAVGAALAAARVGGTIVLAGTVLPTASVALDPETVVRRMLTIRGVHNYAPADLATAVDFLARPGRSAAFADLVGRSFRLADAAAAIAHAQESAGLRVAIIP